MEEKRETAEYEGRVKTTAQGCSQQMPLACPGQSACCSQHEALPRKTLFGGVNKGQSLVTVPFVVCGLICEYLLSVTSLCPLTSGAACEQ